MEWVCGDLLSVIMIVRGLTLIADVLDGAFFVFPDLSVTVLGRYRLRFTLFHLDKFVCHFCP